MLRMRQHLWQKKKILDSLLVFKGKKFNKGFPMKWHRTSHGDLRSQFEISVNLNELISTSLTLVLSVVACFQIQAGILILNSSASCSMEKASNNYATEIRFQRTNQVSLRMQKLEILMQQNGYIFVLIGFPVLSLFPP